MESRKTRIMPFIFVCGMGILNLLLMSMPFFQRFGLNISGYVLISTLEGALGAIISIFQVLIMLLLFFMMIYGAVGILNSCGVSGVDMSKRSFRLFCAVPIIVLDFLYLLQFILIIVFSSQNNCGIGMGIYMSFFLNISITIVFTALLKSPVPQVKPTRTPVIHLDEEPSVENNSFMPNSQEGNADSNSAATINNNSPKATDNTPKNEQENTTAKPTPLVYKNDYDAINHILGYDSQDTDN